MINVCYFSRQRAWYTNSGQSLLEFILSCLILIPLLSGSILILKTKWDQIRCNHLLFDETHKALMNDTQTGGNNVFILNTNTFVKGSLLCKGHIKTMELKKLDTFTWD